ncbi:arsenate reductase (glutaredoxin) [Limibaculum sp. FT325]|uniref:arsenate reductase (glutaredoxin) n=1 Tax=Thermohalobaculum sediminis TaxID=2939436 RepID=UPI00201C50C3|nr:arsenate reductase (glutaredoxin) [Limibaculum sediminis]MCL5778031.1 arsenate reductase (glutaredoxin) [Limibaculum sediminis]
MSVTIWHNPRCSKSRAALALIRERGIEPRIVEYLKTPPGEAEIRDVLARLGLPAHALLRTCEPACRERGLSAATGEAALIGAMAADPVLIERPVVIGPKGARIGRPPEAVAEIL